MLRKFLAAAGMKVRLRGDTDPLGQLPGGSIAGEATSHMFGVRNVTMLRYTRNQRGEIYEAKENAW